MTNTEFDSKNASETDSKPIIEPVVEPVSDSHSEPIAESDDEADSERPNEPTLIVDAQALEKSFNGTVVLQNLTLQVVAGEIFGLIGPSGSGKTTMVHLCCGHLQPSGGSIAVLGEQPKRFAAATRRRIGYMPQTFILHPDLTIEQNVNFAAGLYGMAEWRSREQVQRTLELVELWDARKRPARDASGGMQRRLALAATLVHDPDLIFADEPTANLDPILRAKLWQHFRALAAEGRSLLITTQYIDEAEYCDRVGLMYNGTLIAEGKPEDLRRRAFGGDVLLLRLAESKPVFIDMMTTLPDVRTVEPTTDGLIRVTVASADRAIPQLLAALDDAGAHVQSVGPASATFDQVFIRLIEQHGEARPAVGQIQTSAAGIH